jgi:hypothetical protein
VDEQGEGGAITMRDPNNDIGPINDDDATTSATDDSSVGFGNRPEEYLEDTSPHGDGLNLAGPAEEPAIDKKRDVDSRNTDAANHADAANDTDTDAAADPGAEDLPG